MGRFSTLVMILLWMSLLSVYAKNLKPRGMDDDQDKDGGYTEWSSWSICSKTCGRGNQIRTRTCTDPIPHGNGQECKEQGLGTDKEERQCNCFKCGDACHLTMDLAIIVDTSKSVGQHNLETVRNFLIHLFEDFDISEKETHVALIQYSSYAHLDFDFDTFYSIKDIRNYLEKVDFVAGGTRTDRALRLASEKLFNFASPGFRTYVPNVVMVITDGRTNHGSEPYYKVLQPYSEMGIDTLAVGVGEKVNYAELNLIARGDSQNVFMMNSYDELSEKLQGMVHEMCDKFAIQPTTPPPTTKPKIVECHKAMDLGVIVDSSASVTLPKLNGEVKEFLRDVVDGFPVSEHGTHIGLIRYSSKAKLEFSFKDFYDSEKIKENITNIEWTLGATFTDLALDLATEDLFTDRGGMRKNVPRVLLVITDGRSSRPKNTLRSLIPLQGIGVKNFVLGVGKKLDEEELKDIALDKPEHVFRSDSYDNIIQDLASLAAEVCKESSI